MLKFAMNLPRNQFDITLSLEVPDNHIYCLYGPSAAGKSSILSAIAGFEQDCRDIYLELDGKVMAQWGWQDAVPADFPILSGGLGVDSSCANLPPSGTAPYKSVFIPPWQRRIAYMTQATPLFPHLTVAQNIAYGAEGITGKGRRTPRSLTLNSGVESGPRLEDSLLQQELVERMQLGPYLHTKPRQLSGGLTQRVALARALAAAPQLLLLDEPFSALDWNTRLEMQDLLLDLQQRYGMMVILVTHQLSEAQRVAQTIGLLDRGKLWQQGDAEALMERPASWDVARLLGFHAMIGKDGEHFALHPQRAAVETMDFTSFPTDQRNSPGFILKDLTHSHGTVELLGLVEETYLQGGRQSARIRLSLPEGWKSTGRRSVSGRSLTSGKEQLLMDIMLSPGQTFTGGEWVRVRFEGAPKVTAED